MSIKSGNKKTKQIGKKEVYCLTAGSTLHCYKNPLEAEVIASVELKVEHVFVFVSFFFSIPFKGCVVEKVPQDPKKKKKSCFTVTIGGFSQFFSEFETFNNLSPR